MLVSEELRPSLYYFCGAEHLQYLPYADQQLACFCCVLYIQAVRKKKLEEGDMCKSERLETLGLMDADERNFILMGNVYVFMVSASS